MISLYEMSRIDKSVDIENGLNLTILKLGRKQERLFDGDRASLTDEKFLKLTVVVVGHILWI